MKQLELKHIASYLPYNIKWKRHNDVLIYDIVTLDVDLESVCICNGDEFGMCDIRDGKLILQSLAELFTYRYRKLRDTLSAELDAVEDLFMFSNKTVTPLDKISYSTVATLLENNFDVFGLIDQGLAVDLNKIK